MADRNSEDIPKSKGPGVPGPDALLQIWSSWMEQVSASSRPAADGGSAWWDPTKAPVSASFAGGIQHLQNALSRNPTLRSIDQMWNANPLREVIPLDWAEIARALRIVWLRALGRPETAVSVMEFNQDQWRSAVNVWQEAGQRWLGREQASHGKAPTSPADKRFAAPE